jgi:hypothetical protein
LHTIEWNGARLTQANGDPISGFLLSSTSGTDWSQAVAVPGPSALPAPPAFGRLLGGVVSLRELGNS